MNNSENTFDVVTVEALSQYGAPAAEIAAHLGISAEALAESPEAQAAIARGEAKRNLLLRKAQLTKALAGDKTMLSKLGGELIVAPSPEELMKEEVMRCMADFLRKRSRRP